jgi:hypothetical protein
MHRTNFEKKKPSAPPWHSRAGERSRPQHQLLTNCCVGGESTLRAAVSQFEFALTNATARETIFAHL